MKIVDKNSTGILTRQALWPLLVATALLSGIILGNAGAVNTLRETVQRLRGEAVALTSSSLPVLNADIDFEDYNELLGQREEALQQGVVFPDPGAFVNADLRLGETQVPVRIRLLPGAAAHLAVSDKWNYEIVARDNAQIAGYTRANLIDPADNGWLNEWAFSQALRFEGLSAADYQFVRLLLNGDDKGVYALQEGIGPVTYDDVGQSEGIVVSYDIEPLLEAIASFGDLETAAADPLSNIAGLDPRFLQVAEFEDPLIREDPALQQQAERATALLRGLQSGELAASDVFDAEQYGHFLAMVDLWGADQALSPINLRYRYNAVADRLEPIAMNGNPFSGDTRLPLAAMYNDPEVQAAYTAAADRLSVPGYRESLRMAMEEEYSDNTRSMPASEQTTDLWSMLAHRQEQLRLSLHPLQPVIAQLGSPTLAQDAVIRVNVANALNVPLEILGFDIDGATFLDANPDWIVAGHTYLQPGTDRLLLRPVDDNGGLGFVTFDLPLAEIIGRDKELTFLNEVEIRVATRVLGLEDTQLTLAGSGLFDNR